MTEVEKMQAVLALKTELDFSYQDLEGDMMPEMETWAQFPNLTFVNLSHTLGCTWHSPVLGSHEAVSQVSVSSHSLGATVPQLVRRNRVACAFNSFIADAKNIGIKNNNNSD